MMSTYTVSLWHREPIPEDTRDVFEFTDSRFVEVLARGCRVWLNRTALEPEAVLLGEAVIQVKRAHHWYTDPRNVNDVGNQTCIYWLLQL
jgi:hypothetical protein